MTYRYRSWYRPSRGSVPRPVAIGAAVVAASALASGAGQVTHHHHHHAPPAVVVPASPGRKAWARAFLADARLPATPCTLAATLAWIATENSNPAWHNLLDSTQPEPGSYPVNSDHVQAYTSQKQGLAATVTTIHNGLYPGILAAFRAGNAQTIADQVAQSPWGTQVFTAEC